MRKYCYVVSLGLTVAGVCLSPVVYSQTVPLETIDYPALVKAIAAVESGNNPRAVGKAGERGLMQLKPETWREMTLRQFGEQIPFARAFEPELNQQIGQAYLEHLATVLCENKDRLNDAFLPVLVAAYHCGPSCLESVGFATRRLSMQAQEYVERVLNLHGLYSSQEKMMAMETHLGTQGSEAALVPQN